MLYTSGFWHVRDGHETEFIQAWARFSEWSVQNATGSPWAKLLRRDGDPRRFLSFGPWDSADNIAEWRATPQFKAFVAEVEPMLEAFDPGVYEVVAAADRPS